jgi:hypothetical protein
LQKNLKRAIAVTNEGAIIDPFISGRLVGLDYWIYASAKRHKRLIFSNLQSKLKRK